FPLPKVAGQSSEPATAKQATRITHRILAVHALPIRHRRTGDHAQAKQIGAQRSHHQRLIASLAVADDERARRLGLHFHHPLEDFTRTFDDVGALCPALRFGGKSDKIDRVARRKCVANLTLCLEAADARPLASAWVHHYYWALERVNLHGTR